MPVSIFSNPRTSVKDILEPDKRIVLLSAAEVERKAASGV